MKEKKKTYYSLTYFIAQILAKIEHVEDLKETCEMFGYETVWTIFEPGKQEKVGRKYGAELARGMFSVGKCADGQCEVSPKTKNPRK